MYSSTAPKCNKKYEIAETKQHTNGYTLYKVLIKEFVTTGPLEYIRESIIWKRYNDFKTLHQHLFRIHREIYLPGRFPPFVKPKIFGRFDNVVIQERVKCSQDLLDFATQHVALYSNRWFEEFFKNSKTLEKGSELGHLKEAPLAPQHSNSKPVETLKESRLSSLTDADLHLFDPCLNSATDTSDEAARNDWLAIVQGVSKPEKSTKQESDAKSCPGSENRTLGNTAASGSSSPSEVPKLDLDSDELDELEDLRINVTDEELAAYHSSNQPNSSIDNSVSCDGSLPLSSVPNSVVNIDSSDSHFKPNYDAFKEFVDSDLNPSAEGGIDWTSGPVAAVDCKEQSDMYCGNGTGLVKEEHWKSSKARAYLKQIKDHKNSEEDLNITRQTQDDGLVNGKNSLKNLKGSKSSKDLRDLKSSTGNVNFNNANDSLRRASEPNSEIKGSLLDLKRFFLEDNGDELRGLYLVEAAKYISKAQNAESGEMYQEAVNNFKSAISILLQGVQDDTNEIRIQAVRRKTSKYLKKVEEIHEKFLKNMVNNTSLWSTDQNLPQNQFDDNEEGRERSSSNDPQDASSLEYNWISRLKDGKTRVSSPRHSSKDLVGYKVLGVVGKVLLVLDTLSNNTYVIKILQKSTMKRRRLRKAVIPTNVPYMVQLHRFYSTENFIYLILEYASGGKLWEQLSVFATPVRNAGEKLPKVRKGEDCIQPLNIPCPNGNKTQTEIKEIVDMTTEEQILEPQTPKLKNSWPFLDIEDDNKTSEDVTTNSETQTSVNIPTISTEDQANIFTIDSVSTLSDEEIDKQAVIGECPPSPNADNIEDECFNPELLSEQDLSTLVLSHPDTPNRVTTPLGAPLSVSPIPDTHLTLREPSPAVSLHSSTDLDELVTEDADPEQNPIVVNRIVNEHGISTASPTLHYRSRTKSTVSTLSLQDSLTDKGVEKGVSALSDVNGVGVIDKGAEQNNTFALFKRMNTTAMKSYRIPEKGIQQWGAELIIAIGTLHSVGILCRDLNPDNILLTADGHIRLTYFSKWKQVEARSASDELPRNYSAPEMFNVATKKTEACDWWCLGCLLYELLIGKPLHEAYPSGISSHTVLKYPDFLSEEAKSLLDGLLTYHPTQRLGYGMKGLDDLMSHPFFKDTDWDKLLENFGGR